MKKEKILFIRGNTRICTKYYNFICCDNYCIRINLKNTKQERMPLLRHPFYSERRKKQGKPLLDKRPTGQYNKSRATVPLPTAQICNWLLPIPFATEATTTIRILGCTTSTPDTTLPSSVDLSPLMILPTLIMKTQTV